MTYSLQSKLIRFVVSCFIMSGSSQTIAAGFAIIEQSASGLGNAFAGGAAVAQDATTIFFNPAGLRRLESRQLVVAGHIIAPQANFSNTSTTDLLGNPVATGGNGGNAGKTVFVPNFYYATPFNQQISLGIGINAPFGLRTKYDSDWIGRYQAIESDLTTVNINPSLAWQAGERLALGFGINAQYAKATLTRALDTGSGCVGTLISTGLPDATAVSTCATNFGLSPQQNDGLADITGDDWSWGFNLGLLYELNDSSRLGFAYRSRIKHSLKGDADFTIPGGFSNFLAFVGSGSFIDTGATAALDLPETASLSLYHDINANWSVMADATYTRWSRFEELRIKFASGQNDSATPEQWNNVWRFSLGANYRIDKNLTLRAGLALDQEPIPNDALRTPRIPGHDRTWLALGARFTTSEQMDLDIGYAHLQVSDTHINHSNASAGTIIGDYNSSVDIFSAQLNYRFD